MTAAGFRSSSRLRRQAAQPDPATSEQKPDRERQWHDERTPRRHDEGEKQPGARHHRPRRPGQQTCAAPYAAASPRVGQ